MNIPENLREAIEKETQSFSFGDMVDAREDLTGRYRQRQRQDQEFMTSNAHRCAYLAARMPATYSVIYRVLLEVRSRMPDVPFRTLLDLGAGPGTAMWAACGIFPQIEHVTLVEKDSELAKLGQRLASHSDSKAIREASWQLDDLSRNNPYPQHDLVVLSYSIGELAPSAIPPLIESCWNSAARCLVAIEPGTPVGFERIRAIRSQLIALGAHLAAPCPHALACPMAGGDWCHFSERVDRTSLHRRLKGGTLGYEDEKYSYAAVSKTHTNLPNSRVLRHPLKRSGHVVLTLCTANEGLKQETVSKRTPEAYKLARKLEWGDPF